MFPEFYRMIDELHEALIGVWKPLNAHGVLAKWRETDNGFEIEVSPETLFNFVKYD